MTKTYLGGGGGNNDQNLFKGVIMTKTHLRG